MFLHMAFICSLQNAYVFITHFFNSVMDITFNSHPFFTKLHDETVLC